jgi:hypothetical protein
MALTAAGSGSLEDFWLVMGEAVNGPGGYFGRNLDGFNDCLGGGFGTPEDDDYIVEWHHHGQPRAALGYPETVRQLERRLARCHPSNRPAVGPGARTRVPAKAVCTGRARPRGRPGGCPGAPRWSVDQPKMSNSETCAPFWTSLAVKSSCTY